MYRYNTLKRGPTCGARRISKTTEKMHQKYPFNFNSRFGQSRQRHMRAFKYRFKITITKADSEPDETQRGGGLQSQPSRIVSPKVGGRGDINELERGRGLKKIEKPCELRVTVTPHQRQTSDCRDNQHSPRVSIVPPPPTDTVYHLY